MRSIWLVVGLAVLVACNAMGDRTLKVSSGCVWIGWEGVAGGKEAVYRKFESAFGIKGEEIELEMPCRLGDVVLVAARGKGRAVPSHQAWMVEIKGNVITIPLSQ